MKHQLTALLSYIILVIAGSPLHAQLDPNDSTRPRLNEGQLFTVRLVPNRGRLQVFVAGKPAAQINLKDITLAASGKLGSKTWAIGTVREGDHFLIQTPALTPPKEQFDLKLEVKAKGQSEDFEFNSLSTRP